ncbi:MAG: DNA polymerase I [Firmicutes bacterium]|nr:DNA polymerase I [Bacillota bacterium]
MLADGGGSRDKVVLVDGHSLLHRAFYALPTMTTSAGEHTNAALGFTNMLLRLLEDEEPDFIGVAFDLSGPTFRHEQFEDYKGHRPKMPDDLVPQVQIIKDIVKGFSIPVVELEGYEADDIIGTLACYHGALGRDVLIVTGDRDCLQLVDDNIKALITRRGIRDLEIYDAQHVEDRHGVPPSLVADLKGLMGDTSDNIPGIPGIGPKTGVKLLQEYGSLDGVLANVDKLRGKQRENVAKYAQQALLSRELATIHCSVPVDADLSPYAKDLWKDDALYQLFARLEFRSLISRLSLSGEPQQVGLHFGEDEKGKDSDVSGKFEYEFLASVDDAKSFLDGLEIRDAAEVGTLYLDPYIDCSDTIDAKLVAIGISDGKQGGFIHCSIFADNANGDVLDLALVKDVLGGPLENPEISKVCFDAKALFHALANCGLKLTGPLFDISLAAYLLNPGQSIKGIETVFLQTLDLYLPSLDELTGKGAKAISLAEVNVDGLVDLSKGRLAHMATLKDSLWAELEFHDQDSLYQDVELPLARVLGCMERRGVAVDTDELRRISQELGHRIDELTDGIYVLAGTEFNINSPKQLAEILFEGLGLPIIKETKTGPSTDAEVLEQLAEHHEIAELLMDYRQLVKLKSTYLDSLEPLVHPTSGRIHTSFHQTATATGRLSSVNPNLQNIPVRTEEGRRIRKAFVAGSPDAVLLTADYSQIELRILAHMAQDEIWLDAFRAGADIHSRTAAEVFGLALEDVTPSLRDAAKAINFGIIYGISSFGLAKGTGLTRQDAQTYIDRYFEKYAGVKLYLDRTVTEAREQGYVETLFGRRRYLPDITSRRWALRNFAERAAMNAPIQGTAADIIKMAMVALEKQLAISGLRAQMLIQVHDELVLEVHKDDLLPTARLTKQVMEGIVELSVPLVVDVKAGPNWLDATSVALDR